MNVVRNLDSPVYRGFGWWLLILWGCIQPLLSPSFPSCTAWKRLMVSLCVAFYSVPCCSSWLSYLMAYRLRSCCCPFLTTWKIQHRCWDRDWCTYGWNWENFIYDKIGSRWFNDIITWPIPIQTNQPIPIENFETSAASIWDSVMVWDFIISAVYLYQNASHTVTLIDTFFNLHVK